MQVHGTDARVSAGAESRTLAENRTTVAMEGIELGVNKNSPASVHTQFLDMSSAAQSLDGGPSSGETAFPRGPEY